MTFDEVKLLDRDEARFFRLIEEREVKPDGSMTVTLPCGHQMHYATALSPTIEYVECTPCIAAVLKSMQW